jgi:Ca2+-binding RTX toxin-like protein
MGSLFLALAVGALVVTTAAPARRHAPERASFFGPYTGVATGEQTRVSHQDNKASGDSHVTSDSDEDYQARFTYSFRVENGEIAGTGEGVYLAATWHLSGVNGKYGGFSCDPEVTGTPFHVEVYGFKLDNELIVSFFLGNASETNDDYDCGAHFTGYATKSEFLFDSMLQTADANGAAEYFRINAAHPRLGHFTSHKTEETDTVKRVIDNTWDITITPPSSTQDDSGGPAPSTAKKKGPGTQMCTINGTPGKDILHGTSKADVICGFGGNDVIFGGGGDDIIIGGPGNDKIDGGAGFDLLYGDAGNDSFSAKDGTRDTVVGGTGKDRATVDKGKDVATGVEKVS